MPTKPPLWFQRALANLDPLFNIRWGDLIQQWVIERKSVVGDGEAFYLARRFRRYAQKANQEDNSENRETYLRKAEEIGEELRSAQGGKRVILFTPVLNDKVYNSICAADMKRYGGYARIADAMEQAQEAENERMIAKQREELRDISKEVYDVLDFLWRKRGAKMDYHDPERKLSELLR